MTTMNITIPNLDSDDEFPIVEVFAKKGDMLEVDSPIIMLESDKASMEIPSPEEGVLKSLNVRVGDLVKSGQIIGEIETKSSDKKEKPIEETKEEVNKNTKEAATNTKKSNDASKSNSKYDCEMLVIGSGPGGYSAAFRSADLGMKTTLIEKHETLGGVCLNVGCIPSKVYLHITDILREAKELKNHGIHFEDPKIDVDAIRAHKEKVVKRLVTGISGMAKTRKVNVINGFAKFIDEHTVEVFAKNGTSKEKVTFEKAIIAAGSKVVKLPFMPDSKRVIDSTGALAIQDIPKRMLVIGGGIIGMEMATVYSTLGSEVSVVELSDNLMPGSDADLVKVWLKENKKRFKEILLKTGVDAAKDTLDGIEVSFSGENDKKEVYDKVLVAVGRQPNGLLIDAEKAGVNVSKRGFIDVDKQMRTNISHIFAIGDIVGQPMLAHKATHEGHVAAEAANGEKSYFDVKVIPSVAYTSPEIAFVGLTESEAKEKNIAYEKSVFPWAALGKAIANDTDSGFTKLLFDPKTDRILGGSIVGSNAGDLIAEIALAIEMGADATDVGKTIHPHPTLSESIGLSAELFEGVCTDLPPKRK